MTGQLAECKGCRFENARPPGICGPCENHKSPDKSTSSAVKSVLKVPGENKCKRKIQFTAYGDVQPAHRPRAVRFGKGVRMHNDPRHDAWMDTVAYQALEHRPADLLDGPLKLLVDVYVLKPKSTPKKQLYPISRPDCSNYCKAIEDALNRVIYVDDARLVDVRVRKF